MNKILDGKALASKIREQLKGEIHQFSRKPALAVIQIANNEASNVYIKAKEKAASSVGILFHHYQFDVETSEEEILKRIHWLNESDHIDGIILQLPIPSHFAKERLMNAISFEKDVDGLSVLNVGCLMTGQTGIVSCTPKGIVSLLEEYNIDPSGMHVVIVGRSNLVSKPLISLFLDKDATVTVTHSKTRDLKAFTAQADLLVVATGRKDLITGDMVKEGAIVIDVGINRENGTLFGDVRFSEVYEKASFITPVPGGVGPMTVAMLLKNVVESYKSKKNR